ncbi:hypothetical protein ACICHK_00120 [Streptomyces sp. AHU1]|uniref:hypothetical protein n=1 Tax=Streptomyces sp. AHU1 TaxID=3377215 RepID=UPI0038781828
MIVELLDPLDAASVLRTAVALWEDREREALSPEQHGAVHRASQAITTADAGTVLAPQSEDGVVNNPAPLALAEGFIAMSARRRSQGGQDTSAARMGAAGPQRGWPAPTFQGGIR